MLNKEANEVRLGQNRCKDEGEGMHDIDWSERIEMSHFSAVRDSWFRLTIITEIVTIFLSHLELDLASKTVVS